MLNPLFEDGYGFVVSDVRDIHCLIAGDGQGAHDGVYVLHYTCVFGYGERSKVREFQRAYPTKGERDALVAIIIKMKKDLWAQSHGTGVCLECEDEMGEE